MKSVFKNNIVVFQLTSIPATQRALEQRVATNQLITNHLHILKLCEYNSRNYTLSEYWNNIPSVNHHFVEYTP